jgi:7-keto-8-aminopelargonate synthetase-like enzyme
MAGITLAQAEARLADYLAAEEAVLSGQSYRLNTGSVDRMVTRADLAAIQQGITIWDQRAKQLGSSATGRMVRRVSVLG